MFIVEHTKAHRGRVILLLLSFFVALLLPIISQASPSAGSDNLSVGKITLTNIDYKADLIGESTSPATAESNAVPTVASEIVCKNADEVFTKVRESMLSRITNFSIAYSGEAPETVLTLDTYKAFLNKICSYDDASNSSDYDYLRLNWTKTSLNIENNGNQTIFRFSFEYLTNASKETYIDQSVQTIIDTLNVDDSSDYEKIKAVNDYIKKKVSYDSSLGCKSAYDALYSVKTICRGYALLAYKLLDELSVPVRIITGMGSGKPHAWNIVELDGKWYNMDITWDDQTHSECFFLKNNKDFNLHKRDAEFNTDSFNSSYPLAQESYVNSAA